MSKLDKATSPFLEGKSVEEEVDGLLDGLRAQMLRDKSRIRSLMEENVSLRSAAYKDDELRRVAAAAKKIQDDASRGFPITEEEANAIQEWKKQHEKDVHGIDPDEAWRYQGVSGGGYAYIFLPTSIGVSGTIRCHCGAEFEFREID